MAKLRNLLFYGGLDKETYDRIRPGLNEENRKSVRVFTVVGAVCFLFTAVASMISSENVPLVIYYTGAGVFLLMFFTNELCYKKCPGIADVFALIYSVALLLAGIVLAYSQSTERTTLLLPLFTLVSLVFCYRPVYLTVILAGAEITYLLIMRNVQAERLYFINAVNTGIFCSVGIASGFFTLTMKHKKYKAEYENKILLEKDILTGLYNRFSCRKEMDRIIRQQDPVTFCSFDINGLKQTNDTGGHLAGDELIQGAANCIRDVFGKYGNVYRIGGDEFCALLPGLHDEDRLRRELKEKTAAWKGSLTGELSIAFGMAIQDHGYEENLDRLLHEADLKMYQEKQDYYREHDRRKI